MLKYILLILSLFLVVGHVEAQRCCPKRRCCYGCLRYMNLSRAEYDGIFYGYVDNLNYPDPYYAQPINRYFNYCPCTRQDACNVYYLKDCIHYTNQKYQTH